MLYTIYYTILCYRVILYSTTILYYYSMLYTVSFHIIPIEESSGISYRPHIRCSSIRQHQQPENKCQDCKPYAITEILIGSWSSFLFHMVITRKMVTPPPTPKKWCGGIYSPRPYIVLILKRKERSLLVEHDVHLGRRLVDGAENGSSVCRHGPQAANNILCHERIQPSRRLIT